MNSEAQFAVRSPQHALASLLTACLLMSCSGPSTYNNSANPPIAVAHAINTQPTSAAGVDPVAITVRSQSQVTLTGNASSGGAAAIGNFAWAQTDAAPAPQVVLLYLDADTVTFTAPKVAQDTTLNFTLTVTTTGNAAATAHVIVTVKAVNDPDQFLALLPTTASPTVTVRHHFKVAVDTVEGLGPLATVAPAPLASDVPVCVTVTRTINYINRDRNHNSVTLAPLQADTTWAASIGGAPNSFASFTNPRVTFDIPALNRDDIDVLYRNPVPDGANAAATRTTDLSQQLVPSDIDKAQLSLMASAAPGPCDPAASKTTELAGKTLQVSVQDEDGAVLGNPGASATFTPDQLVSQQPKTPYETAETAAAYYAAIDPTGAKTTLTSWLTANCFDPTKSDFGADAHAVYTNNFDLGLGRDMYFITCKAGSSHVGDMASVVINYVNLEAAASKLNPIIAVAMEYATAAGAPLGSRRFPKFYIFAPDDRDGNFYRVSSANFDHRGEKYVPGACIMCHGGHVPPPATANFVHTTAADYPTIPDPTANATGELGLGDVDATFLPWDLDSFLYSSAPSPANTDPSFVGLSVNAADYTRAAQEPNLKMLNELAYCTYQPEMEKVGTAAQTTDRFNAVRALVSRWYGGVPGPDKITYPTDPSCARGTAPTASLLPGASYDDVGSTPAGWLPPNQTALQQQPGATPTLTSDMVYHQVFARNCRACHTSNAEITDQFTDYPTFMQQFQSTSQKVKPPAVPGLGIQYALMQGRMPLARLTMDRFWVDYLGNASAATLLATHVEQVNGETDLMTPASCDLTSAGACTVIAPGAPVPNLNLTVATAAPIPLPPQGPIALPPYGPGTASIIRFGGASGDASTSFFITDYNWTLCLIPPTGGACAPQDLVGAQSASPSFANYAPGEYDLTLAADNGVGGTGTKKYKFTVAAKNPVLAACPSTESFAVGPSNPVISFSSCITGGDEPAANLPNTFEIQDPTTGLWSTSVSTANWSASTSTSAALSGQQYSFVYGMSFAFAPSATADVPNLAYRVRDYDGSASATGCPAAGTVCGSLDVKLTDTLHAGGTTVVFSPPEFAPPAVFSPVTFNIAGSLLSNTIVPPGAPGVTMQVPSNLTTGAGGVPPSVTIIPSGASQFPLHGSLTSSSVSAQGSFVYTPPQSSVFVSLDCDVNGNSVSNAANACVGDTFYYYLLSGDSLTTSPNVGGVTVQVKARTSFSRDTVAGNNIYNQLGSVCSACHGISGSSAYLAWAYSNDVNTGVDNTYTSITSNASVASLIVKGNAAASKLYTVPCTKPYFDGINMPFAGPPVNPICTALINWINEGAYED